MIASPVVYAQDSIFFIKKKKKNSQTLEEGEKKMQGAGASGEDVCLQWSQNSSL